MNESFSDYVAPSTFVNPPVAGTQNGGQGWNTSGTTNANDSTAAWGGSLNAGLLRTVTSPGLTYTATNYLAPSGNKLTLDASTTNLTQNIGRATGGQTIDSGTTYFSLLMSRNTPDTIRTFNYGFFNGTSERFGVGQIGAAAGNGAGNIVLYMNNQNPAGIIGSATPIAMGNSVTHLIIGRIDWNPTGFETVSIWVDPTDVTTEIPIANAYATTSGFELTAITAIRAFAGNTAAGFNGVSANFDEMRLGGTWESVTSLPVPAPEPATIGLMAVGVLGLCARRRARN